MAYESPMDAARRRAGLKPIAEAQEEDRKKRLAEHRAKYGRIKPGEWRKRSEQAPAVFPGRLTDPGDARKPGPVDYCRSCGADMPQSPFMGQQPNGRTVLLGEHTERITELERQVEDLQSRIYALEALVVP